MLITFLILSANAVKFNKLKGKTPDSRIIPTVRRIGKRCSIRFSRFSKCTQSLKSVHFSKQRNERFALVSVSLIKL